MYGWTSLRDACYREREATVHLLLLRGADTSITDNIGRAPKQLIIARGGCSE